MSRSFFLYGATRAGKTHCMLTMQPAGRMIVADVEGQISAEEPSAHRVVLPPPLPEGATDAEKAARIYERNEALEDAKGHALVTWPCLTTRDFHALLAALASGRMGTFSTLGIDSLTFLFDRLIAEICGVSIIHKKAGGIQEEAVDPVFVALPDFSGQGVQRSMELKDWQRFAQKSAEIVTGAIFTAERLNLNLIVTALEEKRDIYEGDGPAKRFLRTQQGPLLRGRISANDLPPLFQFYFRLAAKHDEEKGTTQYAAQTVKKGGWPAGVRGKAAQILKPYELNPDLWAMLDRLGLRPKSREG